MQTPRVLLEVVMGAYCSKLFRRRLALAAALACGIVAAGSSAQAQFSGTWGYQRLSPPPLMTSETVVQRLSRSGFKVLQIRNNGGVFLVDAKDQGARLLRLVIDARDGAILQRYAMVNPRGGMTDAGASAPAPGIAPQASTQGEPSPARPRSPTPRVKPAPAEAAVMFAPDPAPKPVQPPVAVAPPPPSPAPIVGPGYANGVPINPLD